MTEQYKNDQPKLIEMPEHLKPDHRIESGLGSAAEIVPASDELRTGRFNNGVVTTGKGRYGTDPVPIEYPEAQE